MDCHTWDPRVGCGRACFRMYRKRASRIAVGRRCSRKGKTPPPPWVGGRLLTLPLGAPTRRRRSLSIFQVFWWGRRAKPVPGAADKSNCHSSQETRPVTGEASVKSLFSRTAPGQSPAAQARGSKTRRDETRREETRGHGQPARSPFRAWNCCFLAYSCLVVQRND